MTFTAASDLRQPIEHKGGDMVQLDLKPDEQEILRETLESYISDLSVEIADTDSKDFREKLKWRRDVLNKVLASL